MHILRNSINLDNLSQVCLEASLILELVKLTISRNQDRYHLFLVNADSESFQPN